MDKLEKALQKARQQRQAHLLNETRPPAVMPQPVLARGATSLPKGSVELDDNVLDRHRIISHHVKDTNADLFRILRAQVLQTMAKHGFRTLAVTSPNYGDGKTTIAMNLSISIAQDLNQTVLLADLDLRKPAIHSYLGLKPEKGLTDYLAGQVSLPACLMRMPFERLTVLPAGNALEKSSEMLSSPRMADLAAEMKARYADRLVIYDMPPLLEQDDPLAFLPHVDAVLLVVKDLETTTADLRRCMDVLAPASVIGTVLNDQMSLVPLSRKG